MRDRPDATQVSNDEGFITRDELVAPKPLDQGVMEKDPALLNVVLLEDVKKGPSDLVEEDSVLFLFKQF